ncbi:MAG: ABC transporter permease subunit [candidate division NC10 bacterium]|nr:ABC transporter permease subunit [candidate division NC10 bacterium]
MAIILGLVLIALVAPLLASHDPLRVDLPNRLRAPDREHPFGTDEVGRDIYSRVVYGTRISLQIGVGIIALAAMVGTLLGLTAGYLGGKADDFLMRAMDMILAFPSLVLALALTAALKPSLANAMFSIALVKIPVYARLARGQALVLKEQEYVLAARSLGAGLSRTLFRHILPNSLSPILVQASMGMGEAILIAASLSFIGLGAQPPTPEWGAMISTGRKYLMDQWWYPTFPGLAIALTVMGFNLFGDGLRDLLDPRRRGRA